MLHRLSLAVGVAALVAAPLAAQNRIILPVGYANTEALSSHSYPFGRGGNLGSFGCRVQMAYDTVYFTAQGFSANRPIQRLRWRADGLSNPSSSGGRYDDVIIEMSTAAVDHRRLSKTFDQNHGADRTTVYRGPITLLPTGTQSPNVFYIDVTLDTPFPYDPSTGGDLLIDVGVTDTWTGGTAARTDAESGGSFGRSVEASMVMHRFHYRAVTGEAVLNDVAHVVTIDFGGGGQATVGPYGQGCGPAGAVAVDLTSITRPVTGTRFDVAAQNLPAGTAGGAFFLSPTQVVPGLDLSALGAPGCVALVGLGGAAQLPLQPLGQLATASFPVPALPALAGVRVFVQAAAFVPGVNPLGVLTSNGLDAQIGTL